MNLPDRQILLGIVLGAICASAIAAIGPGVVVEAFADEAAVQGVDASSLVRYEGRDYDVNYDDWVDANPLTTTRVKKVEAGKVSYVTITTTATGTYSTDAMFSNHVQYPGIAVTATEPDRSFFSYWSNGRWSAFSTGNAGSFTYYGFNRR